MSGEHDNNGREVVDAVQSNGDAKISGFGFDSLESVRKKLLDLTGRNQLINYKHPKASCVRIIDELPDQIYEELQSGKIFTFIPVPEPTEQELIERGYLAWDDEGELKELKPFPSAERWAQYLGLHTQYELPISATDDSSKHNDLNIQTLMYATELETRLRSIRGKSESALDESGSNVLYVVLGFIEWYESRESELKRLAPLFTLPVKLERARLDEGQGVYRYTVSLKDDGLLTNVTLREKLSNDFDLVLPEIDDDSKPEDYFEAVAKSLLKHEPRWRIHRMATLAILNFTKQVMYEDLDPDNWPNHRRIEDHPIIKQFFSSTANPEPSEGGFIQEYPIDQIDQVHEHFPIIFEADSSQHSALIDAAKGENLVIEGPPGSGKSQTITNLIAACIANGQRVLFVAEKMAALEVVKHRLDRAGLGDFCLELHSHKTQKQRLLEDLNNRLNKQNKYPDPAEIDADIARFEDLKEKLNRYVSEINAIWKQTGHTIHDIFHRATRYREALKLNPESFFIEGVDGETLTPVRRRELTDLAEMLKTIYLQVQEQSPGGQIANHFWYGINNADLLSHQQDELIASLNAWNSQLERLNKEIELLTEIIELPETLLERLDQISTFAQAGQNLPDLLGGEPFSLITSFKDKASEFERLLLQYESLHSALNQLCTQLTAGAVTSEKAPDAVLKRVSHLKALGALETLSLAELQFDFDAASEMREKANSLIEQLTRIQNGIPQNLQELAAPSINGFSELNQFVRLLSLLPSDLLQHRDPVYDAPEMDELLSQLTVKFTDLVPLHQELQAHFNLSILPDSSEIKQLANLLANSGYFSFLSKSWRQARNQCLALSSNIKPDKKLLFGLLPKLSIYKQGLENVDKLNQDNNALQGLYLGIDTPISRIVEMRAWYRAVRQEYGRGFDPRAKYAEAIFELPRDVFVAMASLANTSFTTSLNEILKVFKGLADHFGSHPAVQDRTISLIDAQSPWLNLQENIQKPLKILKQCIKQDSASLAECNEIAKKLSKFQQLKQQWQQSELIKFLSPKILPLEIAPGRFNEKALAIAKNYLAIVRCSEESEALFACLSKISRVEEYIGLRDSAVSIQAYVSEGETEYKQFSLLGKVNREEWIESSDGSLKKVIRRNANALDHKTWLNNWLEYLRLRRKLTNQGMSRILSAVEDGQVSNSIILDVVNLVLMHQLSNEVLNENPFLAEFSGLEQMAIRDRFRDYDRRLLALQRQKIAFKAARGEPPAGNASGRVGTYSDVALLRHEAGKKKGHIAVRRLIERAGNAIQVLKPCFMMSPMSVAQYLKPGNFEFDIVVMDEASQIRPEDALGSIARGRSLVVVGDPKQLPPTSFFDKITIDDLDDDSVALEETESILESSIPMFRTRRLRWHYRSRHESLIAFSNLHYYNSDLVIFPSPFAAGQEFGVHYHKIKRGRFSRGKNVEEARAIAFAAMQHLLQNPQESLGLVAMNAAQSLEIEMHVEQLVKESPQIKEAYDSNLMSEDPLFIKNLENVQGDERDVIMISMTYGPDEVGGRVFQRFGPINKDVGWRRLNVLFTRSKKRMHIFSSMDSHDVLISGTSKKGVQSLRKFLEYCESGHLINAEVTERLAESDFEVAVKNALSEKGYECEPQLGVAGYYLDLAVKDLDYPGSYLLGIECDGATYHSAKSARDRDRLRQEILESLGWKIHRIWSTDWFKNPAAQLQPILNELENITQNRSLNNVDESDVTPVEKVETDKSTELKDEVDQQGDGENRSLHSILVAFDTDVIRPRFNQTNSKKRLLRPAMLEALINELPTSKEEFAFKIPGYLRSGTDTSEAKEFLDAVLKIIGNYG